MDIFFILFCSFLVFEMQIGFLCLETGFTRSKNSINVAVKNIIDFSFSTVVFALGGFHYVFDGEFALFSSQEPIVMATFVFQAMFCGTATTIISGAIAERTKFKGYVFISILTSMIIYSIFANWVWEGVLTGSPTGLLGRNGFVDFAGSSVVHSIGGWASLALVLIIGPRIDEFRTNSKARLQGSNLPFAMLGAFTLWIGWFGFNAGSLLKFQDFEVMKIFVNTLASGICGLLGSLFISYRTNKLMKVEYIIIGLLAGLVSVTAGCHAYTMAQSSLIGLVGSLVALTIEKLLISKKIDDVVGAIATHGASGAWGTIAVGMFGDLNLLATGLDRYSQIGIQLIGTALCFTWGFGASYSLFFILNKFYKLRVQEELELVGLNYIEHGASNEYQQLFVDMKVHELSKKFDNKIPENPHTETGLIAHQYNKIIGVVQDLFIEKNNNLQRLEKESKRAQKAEKAKGQFLANMSHEIRTPLNGIIGSSDLLNRSENLKEEELQYAKSIESNGKHLLTIVNDILDLSKINENKMALEQIDFSLKDLLKEVWENFEPTSKEKGIRFELNMNESFPLYVKSDPTKIKQILNNLISNAIKFTDSGFVSVNLEHEMMNDHYKLRFEVSDSGIGIEKENILTILDPFSQEDSSTSRKFGGTGLGLSISNKILQQLGSELEISSTKGKGSSFSFSIELPMTTNSKNPIRKESFYINPALKIMVVEDNPINQKVLSQFLKKVGLGKNVTFANNGRECLDKLRESSFDLILMDVQMPIMDGIEATKKIRASGNQIRIIGLSANCYVDDIEKGIISGMDGYESKPLSFDKFRSILAEASSVLKAAS